MRVGEERLLADAADRFSLLKYGLAVVLIFIGVKMLIMDLYKIPIPWMLGTVFAILALSIAASLLRSASVSAEGLRPRTTDRSSRQRRYAPSASA